MSTARPRAAVPALAVALGFALGTAVLASTGRSVSGMYEALLQAATGFDVRTHAWNLRYVGELVVQTMPIVLTGLAVGFAFRTGLFNIGAEGQLLAGGMGALAAGLWGPATPGLHAATVVLAALAAGGLWGAIPGVLKARFNVHEVVVAIMLNYVALHLNNWAVVALFGSLDRVKTAPLPATALLRSPWLASLTGGSRLNWGFVPVVLALVVYAFLLERTTFGFSLRAVGGNRDAARNAGMPVRRSLVASMIVSGAFAGLAGAVITAGTFGFGRAIPAHEGYGFDGIAVALVGGNTAGGVLASGLLFGLLKAAQPLMQSRGIPKEIAGIIQASIVLFVAMRLGLELLVARLRRPAPAAAQPEGSPAP